MTRTQNLIRKTALLCLGALTLSGCHPGGSTEVGQVGKVVAMGETNIGGPFTLTDQNGQTFTEADLIGKPSLIYFGFSFCPDVCPTALQKMGAIQESIDKDGAAVRYIFVGVDTQRDTPETMKPYVSSRGFPTRLIGLSGTQDQMDAAVAAYRVYAQKVKDDTSAAEYTFDHSDLMILMDGEGQFKDIFTRSDSVPEIATRVKFLIDSGR